MLHDEYVILDKINTFPQEVQKVLLPFLSNTMTHQQWLAGLLAVQLQGMMSLRVVASFLLRNHFDIKHEVNGLR